MAADKQKPNRFVAGGYRLARDAVEPQIRAEVEREYAERLSTSTWLRRWRLRREMKREIERRLDRKAPPGALYSVASR